MIKHRLALILVLILPSFIPGMIDVSAENRDSIQIMGQVTDAFTHIGVDSAKVVVTSKDGSFRKTVMTEDLYAEQRQLSLIVYGYIESSIPSKIVYKMKVPDPGPYIVSINIPGYDKQEVEINIPARRYGRRTKEWEAKEILLQQIRSKLLPEVTVTATKIMMIHRGDTVVYNADYFQLAQGSMLDKLISMMPGLEIKGGGVIYYNNKKLDNLLVNGKDFFKGDPTIALQNLPAYIVKEVKVYEKEDDDAFLNKHYRKKDQPNTLDVVLKKEYSHGWIANVEISGGPALGTNVGKKDSKYHERIFGLHYGDRSRLGIIGNFNNINDAQVANGDGRWDDDLDWNQPDGVTKLALGALTYSMKAKKTDLNYQLDLKATREMTNTETKTSTTTFLNTNDTYKRASDEMEDKKTHLHWTNQLSWKGKKAILEVTANTDYDHSTRNSHSLSAQFSQNPNDSYRCASLDSIYVAPGSSRLLSILTNRLEQSSLTRLHNFQEKVYTDISFLSPLLGNNVHIFFTPTYSNQYSDLYQHDDLQYQSEGKRDYRNRYFDTSQTCASIYGQLSYYLDNMMSAATASWLSAKLSYQYDGERNKGNTGIYNLHTLDKASDIALGDLPSVDNWRTICLDIDNSRKTVQETNDHQFLLKLELGKSERKYGQLSICPTVNYRIHSYTDSRTTEKAERRYKSFDPSIKYSLALTVGESRYINIWTGYKQDHTMPEMSYLLPLGDNSNPLSISLGNPDLKAACLHQSNIGFSYNNWPHNWELGISGTYTRMENSTAMGYNYNATTGVYTYRPENVDGNWMTQLKLSYWHKFGKKGDWFVRTNMSWDFNNSVDLMNEMISVVRNHKVNDVFDLSWRFGKLGTLSFHANPSWQYATSRRKDYTTRSTWDLNYGPTLSLNLPHDISFSTDLRIIQRRGYDDHTMNDNNLIWNANLSWSFTKSKNCTLSLEGYDILQQLSSTRRSLNAQGITEIWYNTVPSYLMLHLQWKFHKIPIKKKM